MKTRKGCVLLVLLCVSLGLSAQTHISVPITEQIYFLLENAQMRGLCKPLSGVKPYSRAVVLSAIDEILSSENGASPLSGDERAVFENEKARLSKPAPGIDWNRGGFFTETVNDKSGLRFSLDAAVSWESVFSAAIPANRGSFSWGTDDWFTAGAMGDMGESFSYWIEFSGGLMRAPRELVGTYNTYYAGFTDHDSYENQVINVYSQPTPYFPYSYKKRWDGSIFEFDKLGSAGFYEWPYGIAGSYAILGEMAGSLLKGHITYRAGRLSREWGGMSNGQSLSLNAMARPFLGVEASFFPFNWFSFSALTGILEYYNTKGIKTSAFTFQNAFSQALFELNFKGIHFDFGSISVWPKRFELGYAFPMDSSFFYQNNIGDFDNLALAANLRVNLPKSGYVWFSYFGDEHDLTTGLDFFKLDRSMYALQGGLKYHLPWSSFSSITFSVTKIEPYCYTHNRVYVPWYGQDEEGNQLKMETAYINNGENIGYYLPPNSAELLAKFETMPGGSTKVTAQAQLIIHGADYGSSAVDGSSLSSELDPDGRNEREVLKKFFLQDGAYQWYNVVRVGVEHSLAKFNLPIKLFGEIGLCYSFFTNIDGAANSGSPSPFSIINTDEYPTTARIIGTIGFKVYP